MNTFGKILIKLVVFTVKDKRLRVFLPKGQLPAGEFNNRASLDKQVKEIMRKVVLLNQGRNYLEQLYTFSYPTKEKVEVDVVYYFLVPYYQIPSGTINDWQEAVSLSRKIEDIEIIDYAIQRLRWKIEYTNVVYSLLPREFTFSELQENYETILGKLLDKRNFRKKILSLGILKDTGHVKNLGKARPAEMFTFRDKKLTFVKIL